MTFETPADLAEGFLLPLVGGGEVQLDLPTNSDLWTAIQESVAAEFAPLLEPVERNIWVAARTQWARAPRRFDRVQLIADAAFVHDALVPLHSYAHSGLSPSYLQSICERLHARLDALGSPSLERLVMRDVLVSRAMAASRTDQVVRWVGLGSKRAYGRALTWRQFFWRVVAETREEQIRADDHVTGLLRGFVARLSPLTAVQRGWYDAIHMNATSELLTHRPLARRFAEAVDSDLQWRVILQQRLDADYTERGEPPSPLARERFAGLFAYLDAA